MVVEKKFRRIAMSAAGQRKAAAARMSSVERGQARSCREFQSTGFMEFADFSG